jgi:PAS domain S-box-containing protein
MEQFREQQGGGRADELSLKECDDILDAIHEDILVADGKGVVIKVSPTFEEAYGIRKEDAIGMTVYELEEQGYFKPSIIAMVLKSGERTTMRQKNNKNRDIVVTATPVKNEKGEITKVVSFSRDITDMLYLQEQYAELENKMERYEEELENLRLQHNELDMEGIVAKAAPSRKTVENICRIAKFDANVLLTGESGVGKNMFAKLIHKKSKRANGPFIDINCGAIPEQLLESELFGYEKGSFTGANKEGKLGLIELAEGGTLLLDEISELPMPLQVKILKVIQEKKFTRVGGTNEIHIDFRLIAVSNKNLKELIEQKLFREDLYYRINVITIDILPLRERREDIMPLALYILDKFNKKYELQRIFSKTVFDRFVSYDWPGNVRELENTIERILLTSETNYISKEQIGDELPDINQDSECTGSLLNAIEKLESKMVNNAYKKCKTTVGVAELLGISQPTATRKIHKYIKNKD